MKYPHESLPDDWKDQDPSVKAILELLDIGYLSLHSELEHLTSIIDINAIPEALLDYLIYSRGLPIYEGFTETQKRALLANIVDLDSKRYTIQGVHEFIKTLLPEVDTDVLMPFRLNALSFRHPSVAFGSVQMRETAGKRQGDINPYIVNNQHFVDLFLFFFAETALEYSDDELFDFIDTATIGELPDDIPGLIYHFNRYIKSAGTVQINGTTVTGTGTSFTTQFHPKRDFIGVWSQEKGRILAFPIEEVTSDTTLEIEQGVSTEPVQQLTTLDYYINVLPPEERDIRSPDISDRFLTFSNHTNTAITVHFTEARDDFSDAETLTYRLYSSTQGNLIGNAELVEEKGTLRATAIGVDSLTATVLEPGTRYWFNVVVEDESGNKAIYLMNSSTTLEETDAPTIPNSILTSQVSARTLTVNFEQAIDEDTPPESLVYYLYTSLDPNVAFVAEIEDNGTIQATGTGVNSLLATNLEPETQYFFNIIVEDEHGNRSSYGMSWNTTLALTEDVTSPNVSDGSLSTSNHTEEGFDVHFIEATDESTPQAFLRYRLFISTINDLNTISNTLNNGTEVASGMGVDTLSVTNLSEKGFEPGSPVWINVLVADEAGNQDRYNQTQASVGDETPPQTVGSLSVEQSTDTQIRLVYSEATDNVTPHSSLIYRAFYSEQDDINTLEDMDVNGTLGAQAIGQTNLTISNLEPETVYYFNVVVEDQNGNRTAFTSISAITSGELNAVPPVISDAELAIEEVNEDSAPQISNYALILENVQATSFDVSVSSKATDLNTPNSQLEYFLYVSVDPAPLDSLKQISLNGTLADSGVDVQTLTATGLTADTAYRFNILVQNNDGIKNIYNAGIAFLGTSEPAPGTGPVPGSNGALSIVDRGQTFFATGFSPASDDIDPHSSLVYELYTSSTNNLGGDPTQVKTNGTLAATGTGVTSLIASGLVPETTYWFNVLVRNTSNDEETYVQRSVTTAPATVDARILIMPLGDSLTNDGRSRLAVWERIEENGFVGTDDFWFVGTQNQSGIVPSPWHEGVGGDRIRDVDSKLTIILDEEKPDIVSLMIGTNDIAWWHHHPTPAACADEWDALVGRILAEGKSGIGVACASIPPVEPRQNGGGTPSDRAVFTEQFNTELKNRIDARIAGGQNVSYAPVFENLDPDLHLAGDGVHLNAAGYDIMGTLQGVAVLELMEGGSSATPPTISNGTLTPSNETDTSFDVSYTKATDGQYNDTDLEYFLYVSLSDNLNTVSEVLANGTLADFGTDVANLTATGLSAGTTYYFNVLVENPGGGKSAYTSNSTQTTGTPSSIDKATVDMQHSMAADLVFYLNFQEGDGTTIYDLTGSGYNAVVLESLWGQLGGKTVLESPSTIDNVSTIPHDTALTPPVGGAWSIALQFAYDNIGDVFNIAAGKGSNPGFEIKQSAWNTEWTISVRDQSFIVDIPELIDPNNLHILFVTVDEVAEEIAVYVDGVLKTTIPYVATTGGLASSSDFRIGSGIAADWSWKKSIYWKRKLTSQEITDFHSNPDIMLVEAVSHGPYYFEIEDNPTLRGNGNNESFFSFVEHAPSTFWDRVAEGGGDIRVTLGDGITQVARAVIDFSASEQRGYMIFSSESASSEYATKWRVYYGSGNPEPDPTSEFGQHNAFNAGCKAIWSMTDLVDLTGGGHVLNPIGSPVQVAGRFGSQVYELNGTNQYFTVAHHADLNVGVDTPDFSVSCVMYPKNVAGDDTLVNKDGPNGYDLYLRNGGVNTGIGGSFLLSGTSILVNDTWQLFHFGFNTASTRRKFYVNGALQTDGGQSGTPQTNSVDLSIGSRVGVEKFFTGMIEILRLWDIELPAAWIEEEYNMMFDANFWNVTMEFGPYYVDITDDSTLRTNGNSESFYDLSAEMPIKFWEHVSADGGDIRVFKGTTPVARAVVDFDKISKRGYLIFDSTGVSTISDNTWRINYGSGDPEPDPTSVYGRNNAFKDTVAAWSMADLIDLTGNGLTLNSNGSPTPAAAKLSRAFNLNGTDQFFTVLHNALLNLGTHFSISFWLRWDATATTFPSIFSKDGGNDYSSYLGSSRDLRVMIGGQDLAMSNNLTENTWVKIDIRMTDTATRESFINGVLHTSTGGTGTPNDSIVDLVIGAWTPTGDDPFAGQIEFLRIISVDRTAAWFEEEYTMQNDPVIFWTTSNEKSN